MKCKTCNGMGFQFIHASFFGSYMTDCVVLDKSFGKVLIGFEDPLTLEQTQRWIDADELLIKEE